MQGCQRLARYSPDRTWWRDFAIATPWAHTTRDVRFFHDLDATCHVYDDGISSYNCNICAALPCGGYGGGGEHAMRTQLIVELRGRAAIGRGRESGTSLIFGRHDQKFFPVSRPGSPASRQEARQGARAREGRDDQKRSYEGSRQRTFSRFWW